jgi:uncharacterized protein YecT (DUF1311 family)
MLFVLVSPGHAQEGPIAIGEKHSKERDACVAKFANDSAIANCLAEELAREDRVLNVVYRDLQAHYDPDFKIALQRSERAWIGFRDVQCDYEKIRQGLDGILATVVVVDCRLRITRERREDLQHDLALIGQ